MLQSTRKDKNLYLVCSKGSHSDFSLISIQKARNKNLCLCLFSLLNAQLEDKKKFILLFSCYSNAFKILSLSCVCKWFTWNPLVALTCIKQECIRQSPHYALSPKSLPFERCFDYYLHSPVDIDLREPQLSNMSHTLKLKYKGKFGQTSIHYRFCSPLLLAFHYPCNNLFYLFVPNAIFLSIPFCLKPTCLVYSLLHTSYVSIIELKHLFWCNYSRY